MKMERPDIALNNVMSGDGETSSLVVEEDFGAFLNVRTDGYRMHVHRKIERRSESIEDDHYS